MSGFDAKRYEEAKAIYAGADCVISPEEISAAYDRLAEQVTQDLADKDPVLICVMLGGMQATVELGKRLDFPFELDYLHATRYRGETAGGELVWKVSPGLRLADRHVLIVDDILDEGHTLAAILDAIRAQGAASVSTAMLLLKDHDRRAPGVQADYVGCHVADRYVFGAGMDYKGYFRQLPGVWAIGRESGGAA
ncbi:hypoxanthine-guanine phosphoribosyltransferase [Salinisphaera sp. Q1T1-3]|uniref:hypoxanthine-guanine phosphoribosyltransferase n=1 Tax=Salinisphaera sp. Q1T1-3 TaxID=2321229 RepID=UPI000E73E178|nr:hypoxanthine-guanine phosphoribosyltransferase [Salinisphaera sp. Q1T1-3]RJS92041.1 hypoxanthine-guanine phosphoribosyltransferase [Salinisphaera sp. Q1T1-3]